MTTDWHDGEYDYCRRLVRDCGDRAVRGQPWKGAPNVRGSWD